MGWVKRTGACVAALTLSAAAVGHASVQNETARINGVADFLLERAAENYLYIVEERIKANPAIRCYFPNTYAFVTGNDLVTLLRARGLWDDHMHRDIEAMVTEPMFALIREFAAPGKAAQAMTDNAVFVSRHMTLEIGGKPYLLSTEPIGADPEVKAEFAKVYDGLLTSRDGLLALDKFLSREATTGCTHPDASFDDFRTAWQTFSHTMETFAQWVKDFASMRDRLALADSVRGTPEQAETERRLRALTDADRKLAAAWEKMQTVRTACGGMFKAPQGDASGAAERKLVLVKEPPEVDMDRPVLELVLQAEQCIRGLSDAGLARMPLDPEGRDYRRFKRYVVFFAEVADAEDAKEVTALLKELTLPPVSFGVKRERGETHLTVSAFLGLSAGVERGTGFVGGLAAPVGLEFSVGLHRAWIGSVGLLAAPFDFAYPINLKLYGDQREVAYRDVISPGAYLTIGVAKMPAAVLVGFNRGAAVRAASGTENRALVVVAIDMPLFALY